MLAGLDPEQRAAAQTVHGPVRILAGAGTGKTRTITHRVGYAVATGEVPPQAVLAVTFTRRAAGELRDRLRSMGLPPVQASTFHAAALRQLGYFWPRAYGEDLPPLVDRRFPLVARAATRVLRRNPAPGELSDLASEVDWAKASLVGAPDYPAAARAAHRDVPVDLEQVADILAGYESLKGDLLDFDDLLTRATALLEQDPAAAAEFRARYWWFSIDEYQDTSPAQQALLDAWLGDRAGAAPELCVVGDVAQTIYTFAGADATHLLGFEQRYPQATTVRLSRDYRSTPQVVEVANRIMGAARGPTASLRIRLTGQRAGGPEPRLGPYSSDEDEAMAVAERIAAVIEAGTPAREIAVLVRTNARAEVYEEALDALGIPYVLRGATWFFDRPEVRGALRALRGAADSPLGAQPAAQAVRAVLVDIGHPAQAPRGQVARERWESVESLAEMAADEEAAGDVAADDAAAGDAAAGGTQSEIPQQQVTLRDWVDAMTARAAARHAPGDSGVTVATLHAAKGLEWDVVFVVGVSEGRLPIRYAETPEEIEEERRLLYVGVTRAREHLWLSWVRTPSRFLDPLLPEARAPSAGRGGRASPRRGRAGTASPTRGADAPQRLSDSDQELLDSLKRWRLQVSRAAGTPAFTVFTDATLTEIATRRPASDSDLLAVRGVGPAKVQRHGPDVIRLVSEAEQRQG